MIDWDTNDPLTALTHLDGRNSRKLSALRQYFSEFAWMKMRFHVMVEYVVWMYKTLHGKKVTISENFTLADAKRVVGLEKTVNHDLKALELFFVSRLKKSRQETLITLINLGLGSEDINSMAFALLFKYSREEILLPAIAEIVGWLVTIATKEKMTVMIARTHGQPANVTTFGKEIASPLSRLCDELELFQTTELQAKCSGEVGSYQAFVGVDPSLNAIKFTNSFVRSLGLVPCAVSTQIAPYDSLIRYLQSLSRINSILLDLSKNMWLYVLLGYVKVKKVEAEVGSAGMPHKVNPIYFEGAEGGLEMANGMLEIFCRKLPVNRLQRDFSDSTMRRNIVIPIALSLLSYQSICQAFDRIEVNKERMTEDLKNHAEVFTETIKAYGTMHGIGNMYERLKTVTRGKILTEKDLYNIINELGLKDSEKQEVIALCNEHNNPYPGEIVEKVVSRAKKLL